jgi:amidophosphoribosyltransferase
LYKAGAKEVHLLISSPPVKYPDFYGINIPMQSDLIAARMSVPEIKEHLGVNSLGYLSYKGLIRATGRPARIFSTSYFNGDYPITIGKHAKAIEAVASVEEAPMAEGSPAIQQPSYS